ncbi:MAG: phosphoribosylformylglycinamidine synthase subunit PurS [Syntrophomonadaceae bacterium]|nr:phosphoribosylformylglycinamidine synthase subunit PurS [Syntrophomonadaceae bacterium]
MYLAKVFITLKPGVLDPQGSAVEKALQALDFSGVQEVRIGKYLEVRLAAKDKGQAEADTEEMCRRLLANPVIENYRFELVEVLS